MRVFYRIEFNERQIARLYNASNDHPIARKSGLFDDGVNELFASYLTILQHLDPLGDGSQAAS